MKTLKKSLMNFKKDLENAPGITLYEKALSLNYKREAADTALKLKNFEEKKQVLIDYLLNLLNSLPNDSREENLENLYYGSASKKGWVISCLNLFNVEF